MLSCPALGTAIKRLLPVALLLLGASTVAAQHRLCFYVDKGVPGHCFVQFLPRSGPQAGQLDLARGKYPATDDRFGGPGEIRNDSKRAWTQRICYPVTAAQYNAAAAKVNTKQTTPPNYHLTADPPGNCVDWMSAVAAAATITLPTKHWWGVGTPSTFGSALKDIGDGNDFQGGTVEFNTDPTTGPDGLPVSPDPPDDVDAEEASTQAHFDPSSVGSQINLPVTDTDLGPWLTTLAAGLDVNVSNTSLGAAVVSVRWGDASDVEAQSLSFSHSYGSAGIYSVSVVTMDQGSLRRWTAQLNVQASGTVDPPIAIVVPTSAPAGGTNPGFENIFPIAQVTTSVPALPVWGHILLAMLMLTAGTLLLRRRLAQAPAGR
jgi:hypothetical protein